MVKSAKEQALRNQILDAVRVAKTHKEVVKNLKNIKISDKGQSKIFKNALNEYIKVNNEQNSKLKNALIKEGVIKGNGFFMDKPDPSKAKSDLNVKMKLEPNVRDLSKLSNDEIVADLEYLANKHKEMFNKPSDVFKLIREIKNNPTFFYKNNQLDIALIGKRLNDNKLGKLGINRNNNEIRHITKSRNADKENERILKRDGKDPLVESPYSTQLVLYKNAEPTANGADALSKGNNSNSTQEKPKKNLIQRLDDDIKAKEEAKKNKKSVKERLDKDIKAREKESDEFFKRFDEFLGKNKNYKLDYLDDMELDSLVYNINRKFIIDAKESIDKGIKKDIPSPMRDMIEQKLNIKALKEFGTNYAEYYHDGTRAIKKLMLEKQGQVAGAFHRKDLGDIDLVWGDGNFGLSHIINKRSKQWNNEKAIKFISHLDENINNGKLVEVEKGRMAIKTQLTTIIIDKKGNNKFVITAFRDRNNKDL